VAAWLYAGLVLGAMMGPTIVFSIPVGLGIINKEDRRFLAMGILAGIVTIPLGCIAGGLTAMASNIVVDGQPVVFSMRMILMNLIPVIIISAFIALGLKLIPEKMISGFQIFAKFLVALITVGLACAVLQTTLGVAVIPGLDPIFMTGDDKAGVIMRAVETIGYIACVLLGAYPMVFLITRWFGDQLMKIGSLLKMNDAAAAGMVATLANNIPMFGMMSKMDDRGKVINVAFCVSAAFTFGDHLGFTAANMPPMIFPVIVGKLVGGVTAVFVAMMVAPKATAGLIGNGEQAGG
jgi:ethanolamine transporter